ncbi:hypothetical protein VKT23_008432 [Stygiomarasmius scandens]|uniref:Uncharacterized protein n=1 Tax=Marasmiellus scandens TaxID=2682957 RepID=A0ABR1JHA1_9AGAR
MAQLPSPSSSDNFLRDYEPTEEREWTPLSLPVSENNDLSLGHEAQDEGDNRSEPVDGEGDHGDPNTVVDDVTMNSTPLFDGEQTEHIPNMDPIERAWLFDWGGYKGLTTFNTQSTWGSIPYTCSGPPDPDLGREAGRKWLRQQMGFNIDRRESSFYITDIAPEYAQALKDVFTIRPDIVHARLPWEGTDDVFHELDDEAWCKLQVFRAKCPDAPFPTFTGRQLEARRIPFFRRIRRLHKDLAKCERKIAEFARAREALSGGSLRPFLFLLRNQENEQRKQMQMELEQSLPIVRAMYFLTAIALVYFG